LSKIVGPIRLERLVGLVKLERLFIALMLSLSSLNVCSNQPKMCRGLKIKKLYIEREREKMR
jgi:hypothetical protein